jgi:hypothetical protein
VEKDSANLPGLDIIEVGLFGYGDEHALGGEAPWLASVYGAFWHELSHVLYSEDTPVFDDPHENYALNLLEDGRAERRMVAEHPRLRPWLRRNVLLGRDSRGLDERADAHGWAHELIVVGTRHAAGVIDRNDFDALCEQIPDDVPLADLRTAWETYIALPDDALHSSAVDEAVETVVPHLRSHHTIHTAVEDD